MMISPTLLPALLAMAGVAMVSRLNGTRRLQLRPAALLVATAIVVVLPYSIERSISVNGPVFVRGNFGLELFISNNDNATATYNENMATGQVLHRWHPMASRSEALRVRQMGEGPYHSEMRQRATTWIKTHPGKFASLTFGRIKEFWFPSSRSTIKIAFLWGLSIASIGWLLSVAINGRDRRSAIARLWLVALGGYSLLHYVIQADVRYRYPVHGLLLLAASAGAADLLRRNRERRAERRVEAIEKAQQAA
jgi:hypothetical protein